MAILGKRSSFRTDADYLLNASCILITVKKIITADIFELVHTEKLRQFGGFVVEISGHLGVELLKGFETGFVREDQVSLQIPGLLYGFNAFVPSWGALNQRSPRRSVAGENDVHRRP